MASSQASGVNTPPYVDFKRAVELMLDGHPVIFPTETFFALGSRAPRRRRHRARLPGPSTAPLSVLCP